MIVRAMRIFQPNAELREKELLFFGQRCVLRSIEMQIFQANGADRLRMDKQRLPLRHTDTPLLRD